MDLDLFHSDSIWAMDTESQQSIFTGGRDGRIYHTDLTGDQQHSLLFSNEKQPITSLAYDEESSLIWFTSSNDSSIKYIDFNKRNLDKMNQMQDNETDLDINLE